MPASRYFRFHAVLRLTFVLLLIILPPGFVRGALPDKLMSVDLDWVCVTGADLVDAYAPLAAYRQSQGLATIVLPLDEVLLWSPHADDVVASLRWLADTAARQWGADYLLLGGSHATLPAPRHRLDFEPSAFENPTDAYYACLDGQWDVDGDGLFAEYEDDAAETTVHLAVGRLPLDTPDQVAAAVAKIMAFEQRPRERPQNLFFAASLMEPFYEPGDPYPSAVLYRAMALADSVRTWRPDVRLGTLFEGPDAESVWDDPLNFITLVDSLGGRTHDLVYLQFAGVDTAWELARGSLTNLNHFAPLADCGKHFLGSMLSGAVADSRDVPNQPCLIPGLLGMAGGGAVALCAPTGTGYYYPSTVYHDLLWRGMLNDPSARLGDVHCAALAQFFTAVTPSSPALSTFWYQSVQGDPATMLQPVGEAAPVPPPAAAVAFLQAAPNPFNPTTTISFEVLGPPNVGQAVRVEVFDLAGRKLATLLDRELDPGPRNVVWQSDLASGVYVVRVTVAGRSQAIKLTLVE